jgi:ribosomal protein S18 acetylase RimI-like enzyme
MIIDPAQLEPIAARGWPAVESARLGGWRLYASAGWSGRINSCWPVSPPDREPDAAIAAVEAWYAARGLPVRFKLAGDLAQPADLQARLAAHGYAPGSATLTMVGDLAGLPDPEVAIDPNPDAGHRRLFADPSFGDTADAEERLAALQRMPTPRGFGQIALGATTAAIGACVTDGDWAGIIGMRTSPEHRRRGLARRVFLALGDFARRGGARRGYLQVEADNAPAVALYRSAGFETAYAYRYWRRD